METAIKIQPKQEQEYIRNNYDDVCVSIYRHLADDNPGTINLIRWLAGSDLYDPIVLKIRTTESKDQRRKLKLTLPCITPSGIFTGRGDANLVNYSGFMQIDIDYVDPDQVKEILSQLPYIFYVGLSVSGRGVWTLIPVRYPDRHKEHFNAIRADFAQLGVEIDEGCKALSQLRFYSYDNEPYFNPNAVRYEKTLPDHQPDHQPEVISDTILRDEYRKIQILLNKIHETQTDITSTYRDWVLIGGTLVSLFGENGRDLFHQFSQYYSGYIHRETQCQYDKCLSKRRPLNIGVIFNISKKYGIYAKT
jgi:hypothetical protein